MSTAVHLPTAARRRGVLLAICCTALAGCAVNPRLELSEISSSPGLLTDAVPFYPQSEYQCAPAALASLLVESGIDTNPEQLSPQVYLPERNGSLQIELLAATRRAGRIPYILESDPRSLIAQIDAGRPVLILQNLRTRSFPAWHYAVLVGYTPETNRVHLNSGTKRNMSMSAPRFLRTWDWGGRWAMVVLKPGELPAMAEPRRYAEAAAAFDMVADSHAAELAWQAAADFWPNDSRPHLALGNLDYRNGDISGALDHFQAGLAIDSQDPALVNNLATVLGELGCPRGGETWLRPLAESLSNHSIWKASLTATLAELAAQPGADPASCSALQGEHGSASTR